MASLESYDTLSGRRWKVRYRNAAGRSTDRGGFSTKRSAELWRAGLLSGRTAVLRSQDTSSTVDFFITRRLSLTAGLKASTVVSRETSAKIWVLPYWRARNTAGATRTDVEDWTQTIADEGAQPPTIANAFWLLHRSLSDAIAARACDSNVAHGIKLPRTVPSPRHYLSHLEVFELADAIRPEYRAVVLFLAYTGVRFGELAALEYRDLDLVRGRARVQRARTEVAGHLITSSPKDGRARSVPLPDFIRELIEDGPPSQRIFLTRGGYQIRLSVWRTRMLRPALQKPNSTRRAASMPDFPAITPHDLRHTAASLAVSSGANVKVLQRMLGHASASMTLDV